MRGIQLLRRLQRIAVENSCRLTLPSGWGPQCTCTVQEGLEETPQSMGLLKTSDSDPILS